MPPLFGFCDQLGLVLVLWGLVLFVVTFRRNKREIHLGDSVAKPKPAPAHPFKEAIFLIAVKNRLIRELTRHGGMTRGEARVAVQEMGQTGDFDTMIADTAQRLSDGAPHAAPVDGPFLDFILAFIASPLFAQLIAMLLSLFAVSVTPEQLAEPSAAVAAPTEPAPATPAVAP